MNFTLSEEQQELVRTVHGFLEKRSPESEVRRLMAEGAAADPAVWMQMGQQLGLQGLIIPEQYGGAGYGYVELGLVLEEIGAALLVSPFLSSVHAASALLISNNESEQARYLPGLAAGERLGTLAIAEASGQWNCESIQTAAVADSDGYRIRGAKMYVLDGQFADFFVVGARAADGLGLFIVDRDASGLTVTPLKTMDQTRAQARIEFDDAPARALSVGPDTSILIDRILATAGIALAAEQVGGAQRCLDMAVDYAKVRVQFGKPIGRQSSTNARICSCRWNPRVPRHITPRMCSMKTKAIRLRPALSHRRIAHRRIRTSPARTSRSTAE